MSGEGGSTSSKSGESSRPSASASAHASAIEERAAMYLVCCPTDNLSAISSIEIAIDSSLPVSLLRRDMICARISFCCEFAPSAI